MKYVYTLDMCSACEELKKNLITAGEKFEERDGKRLMNINTIVDEIDREAFIKLQMQNQSFPVLVEVGD